LPTAYCCTNCTSSKDVYHNWCCEFKSRSGWGVQHYVIKFVSDLRQVMVFSGSSINKTYHHYNWNITATAAPDPHWKWSEYSNVLEIKMKMWIHVPQHKDTMYTTLNSNNVCSCYIVYIKLNKKFSLISLWRWSYGSWIHNYLCNQCLSQLMLWVRISIRERYAALCDKVCKSLASMIFF
jgi:hypothetical protein